jgi:hypothetical protein
MSTENPLSMPLGEALYSLRAMRRLKPDPIPDADLKEILEATIRAPNGGTQQPWRFILETPGHRRWVDQRLRTITIGHHASRSFADHVGPRAVRHVA